MPRADARATRAAKSAGRRILVTGAGGFVGRHLVPALKAAGHAVVVAGRGRTAEAGTETVAVGDIGASTDWMPALAASDTVIHLAGRTPVPGVTDADLVAVNDHGTARLAEQCAASEASLVIAMSSILAVADNRFEGVVDDDTPARGTSAYALSKQAAERHIATLLRPDQTGICLRSPLVYGAGARGNWQALQKFAASRIPLPFGSVKNRRSYIAVENLVGAILAAVEAPDAGRVSGAFAVADRGTASLADVVAWLRAGMGRKAGLVPFPPAALGALLRVAGRGRMAASMLGDLAVDGSRFETVYRWQPGLSTRAAMEACGAAFAGGQR